MDLRGSGESDGLLHDEYLPLEQEDALEVLRWIAAQPWSTGAVGMFGISWGGFNGLQVAAHAPPELKAVITLCSTDDRYADDVHYKGGAVLALEMLSWGASMLSYNAIAPDPEVAGPGWRDAWLERIDSVEPYEYEWLRHQRRDEYWKQGSVCEDFGAIKCPVYAIGGWADGYSEAVLRLVAGLGAPSKGLLGPWSHAFPDEVEPGPAIGFLQECLRWWDQWLKGEDTGHRRRAGTARVDAGPGGAGGAPPGAPRPLGGRAQLALAGDRGAHASGSARACCCDEPGPEREHRLEISTDLLCGLDSGVWCADGNEADAAVDQRADDGRSLSFTSGAAAGADRAARQRARGARARERPAGGPAHGATVRRGARRRVAARDARRAQPDPPRQPRAPRPRSSRGRAPAWCSSSTASPRRSRRGTGCAWRSRRPTGRGSGPRRSRSRSRCTRRPSALVPAAARSRAPRTLSCARSKSPRARRRWPSRRSSPTTGSARCGATTRSGRTELTFDWATGGRYRITDYGLIAGCWASTTYSIVPGDPLSAEVRCRAATELGRDGWVTRAEISAVMDCDARALPRAHRAGGVRERRAGAAQEWSFESRGLG